MAIQPEHSSQNEPSTWKPFCSCSLTVIGLLMIPACLFAMVLFGVTDDISAWFKSLEYPSIEGRFKPIADEIRNVTSDALLKYDKYIGQPSYMTHPESYTGVVAGRFTMVFGTSRSLDDVIKDYAKFLSSKPNWKSLQVVNNDYAVAYNSDKTAKVYITVPPNNGTLPRAALDYATFYQVELIYGDPGLWEG